MDEIKLLTATLDCKKIAYSSETDFLVQVGKDAGAYKTRYSITGNFSQAWMYYQCINIGRGYKKRLLCPAFNKPLLARQFS